MLNPHEYWAECQLVRFGAEAMPLHAEAKQGDAVAMPLHAVTLKGKSKSIAFAMQKLCFYELKGILL